MPKFQFGKPSEHLLKQYADRCENLSFTYEEVGDTDSECPLGYSVDRTTITLGKGKDIFDRAKEALIRLDHLKLGWVEAWSPDIKQDESVIIAGRVLGIWWLNPCRIVYASEPNSINEFAFAYGTLPGHVERGEERFRVVWNEQTDNVTFDILAFSRPNHLYSYVSYPMVRRLQKKFGFDCASKLFRLVNPENQLPQIEQVND